MNPKSPISQVASKGAFGQKYTPADFIAVTTTEAISSAMFSGASKLTSFMLTISPIPRYFCNLLQYRTISYKTILFSILDSERDPKSNTVLPWRFNSSWSLLHFWIVSELHRL